MKKHININNDGITIPATLWGEVKDKIMIAVHGDQSNKEDIIIELLAKNVVQNDISLLSFDLPEHGDRKNDKYECNPQNCIADLLAVYSYAKAIGKEIYLFACSMGAYFSLLAFHEITIHKSFFLSPVVNMERIIQSMMTSFQVSEQRLKDERKIVLPIGKTLDWDYYQFVKGHPIEFNWDSPIKILYGAKDFLSTSEEIEEFSKKHDAKLTILENAEHYFCSSEQLHSFETWLNENI